MNKQTMPAIGTQYRKVLDALLAAKGGWVNKQVFIRDMYLTQAGMVIWNLENKFGWTIEHSEFKDDYGFKSYRIVPETI